MDGQEPVKKEYPYYAVGTLPPDVPEVEEPKPTWLQRRLADLRLTTMSRVSPPYWNTTMVTAWVAVIVGIVTVLGAVGALYLYTKSTSLADGIQIGEQRTLERLRDAEIERLRNENERINKLLLDAGFDINNPPKKGAK